MPSSLLFIPDISGYTNFIQSTEIEHAEHVIAEILEVLIAANTQNFTLAEIEGDALFFYKEGELSSDKLLAQIEGMYTAFYSHLKMMESNRICNCNACASAPNLQLKIVVHSGDIQFLKVQGNSKPFGNSVITVHRLLKNSVNDNNYIILSKALAEGISLNPKNHNGLYDFKEGCDTYDGVAVDYYYSSIDAKKLQLKPFSSAKEIEFNYPPHIRIEEEFNSSGEKLLETITNYKYRHLWVKGADSFEFNENEVTRIGSEHICVINDKQFNFVTVTKAAKANQMVYGELTSDPPPLDKVYNFYTVESIDTNRSRLIVEIYLEAKSILKKALINLVIKKLFKKNIVESIASLKELVEKSESIQEI